MLSSLADMFQSGMVGWGVTLQMTELCKNVLLDARLQAGPRCSTVSLHWLHCQHLSIPHSLYPLLHSVIVTAHLVFTHSVLTISYTSQTSSQVRVFVCFLCFSSVFIPFYRGSVCSNSALPPFFDD